MLKKLLLLFSLCLVFILFCVNMTFSHAYAVTNYVRVVTDDVVFYSSNVISDKSALFLVPKGYYLKILDDSSTNLYCEYSESTASYSKIVGYVEKSGVEVSDGSYPLSPKLSLSAMTNTSLLASPRQDSSVTASIFSGQSVSFYGYATDKNYAFVMLGNDFGYVDINDFENIEIPPHPLPLAMNTTAPNVSPQATETLTTPIDKDNALVPTAIQIILVLSIIIPMVILTMLIFKESK